MDTTRHTILCGAAVALVAAVANVALVLRRFGRRSPGGNQRAGRTPPASPSPPSVLDLAEPAAARTGSGSGEAALTAVESPAGQTAIRAGASTDCPPPPPTHPAEWSENSAAREYFGFGAPMYTPVSPVELRFDGDRGRVGVTPGTQAHRDFKKLADALLADLKDARHD